MGCAKLTRNDFALCKVRIVDYDARWPGLYKREAAKIRAGLGNRALRVEHVGSTSVPNLAAKPVIDVLVVVSDSRDEGEYTSALNRAGYELRIREPEWHEHRMFKGSEPEVNLHVFSKGCIEIDRMLLFRDWLRTHPADQNLYANTKRELAMKTWESVQAYADAKTSVIEAILARAQADHAWMGDWRATEYTR
ncbi:MAG TPA: GrpB family protein [Candidatus Acidoferrales bacterium]|nr:GrpB family protein [Candidatus Acidoferrales bacterium]